MKRSLIILPVAFTFAKNDTCECCHLMPMSFGARGRSHVCLVTWRGEGLMCSGAFECVDVERAFGVSHVS